MKYDSDEYRAFRQSKIEAGKRIDIATAEVLCIKCHPCDVYGAIEDHWGVFDYPGAAERRWFVRPRGSVEADDGGSGAWVCIFDLPTDKFMDFEILFDAGHYSGKPVTFTDAEMEKRRAAFRQKQEALRARHQLTRYEEQLQ
jgi:hypothetical protein